MEISDKLINRLLEAQNVVVLTGAGVSAESGVKTFRDPDGLWAQFNPAELASMNGFLSNPKLVWKWYQHRREIIYNVQPNPGHYAIAEMQDLFENFGLITQNVDRLHQRAGSRNVIELHGNIIENHCVRCKKPYEKEIDCKEEEVPVCEYCGGLIRPSVVWFGELLPFEALSKAEELSSNADVFFSVGTSGEVYPAAGLPLIAKRSGAYVVEVNPNFTSLTKYMDEHIQAPSGVALPKIVEKYKLLRSTKS